MVTLEHGIRRDEELAHRAYAAIMDAGTPSLLALPPLRVALDGGQVTLSGNTATASHTRAIHDRMSRLSGVTSVVNDIVDDGALTLSVWSALAGLPELKGVDRRLRVVLGSVHIDWLVHDSDREAAVDRALANVYGVREVVHGAWPWDDYRRGNMG